MEATKTFNHLCTINSLLMVIILKMMMVMIKTNDMLIKSKGVMHYEVF